MQTTTTQYFAMPGGQIAFDDTAETDGRPSVICVSGMGETRRQYRHLSQHLKTAGYRVITMDLRGQGESSTGWDDYAVRTTGKDIVALIDALGTAPTTIVGNSYGGGAALWAAHDAPQHVKSLVLLDPVTQGSDISGFMKAFYNLLLATPVIGLNAWLGHWDSLFPACKPADHAQYRQALRENLREPGRMTAFRRLMLSVNDAHEALDGVNAPAIVIMGSKDHDFKNPAQEAHELGQKLKAGVHVIDNAGHYPHVEMHEQVCPLVTGFLRDAHPALHTGYAA